MGQGHSSTKEHSSTREHSSTKRKQEHSSTNKVELNTLYLQHQAERLVLEKRIATLLNDVHKETLDNWIPKSMKGHILYTRQTDGSTIRELFIPDWHTVFYSNICGISVRDHLVSDIPSLPVTINHEDAILLHNMWIRYLHSKSASLLAEPILTHYINLGDGSKI